MDNITARTFNDYHNASGSLAEFFKDKPAASAAPPRQRSEPSFETRMG